MASYSHQLQQLFGMRRTTRRRDLSDMRRMLQALQIASLPYPAVQIVGTNGKGSTAAFLASMLQEAGYHVGLFTSPHLVHFNERFQINGTQATNETLSKLLEHTLDVAQREQWEPVFFDVATLMAVQWFAQEQVDIAIMEAGMGGKLDATTSIPSALTILTTIGMDHAPLLGTTLSEIAQDKASAFRPGTPAVVGVTDPALRAVIEKTAQDKQAHPLRFIGRDFPNLATQQNIPAEEDHSQQDWELGLHGSFQKHNASLALAALEHLAPHGLTCSESNIQAGLSNARWSGRCQPLTVQNTTLWLDGAHNPQAMEAIVQHFAGRPLCVVFGAMKDKDLDALLAPLHAVEHKLILCPIRQPRAASTEELYAKLQKLDWNEEIVSQATTLQDAVQQALASQQEQEGSETILVTGSLFLVGEVLEAYSALDSTK